MPIAARLARAIGSTLEEGALDGVLARAGERLWAQLAERSVVRRLRVPAGVRALGIGGATLGGSGKTPLALACAVELAGRAHRVALVGHGYRAAPGWPRIVSPRDAVAHVGDEALACARELEARGVSGVRVVVAPSRQGAIELAATFADVLVLDGVAQTSPERLSLSLLAVDPEDPWGRARAMPPRGDLRAPIAALVAASDLLVPVRAESRGVTVGAQVISWEALRSLRVGLVTALARPSRVLRALAARGVTPRVHVAFGDHRAEPSSGWTRADVHLDLWIASSKCRAGMGDAPELAGVPLATIEHRCVLDDCVRAHLYAHFDARANAPAKPPGGGA